MPRPKLAIVAESTGLTARKALEAARTLGCRGIQFDAVGDLAPDKLGETGRREFKNLLKSHDLALAALNVPLRRGLDAADDLQPRLDFVKKAMALSFDLGARLVVVPGPAIPAEAADPRRVTLTESLHDLGAHGDRTGCTIALECGLDPAETVVPFLDSFDRGSLAVCFDPANFLLNGHDPLATLAAFGRRVAYTHARDARVARNAGGGNEVPLGAGDIEWMAYVATLDSIDFSGYLAVERTTGQNRLDDVKAGVAFLRRFVGAGS
jgi:sugar phosphate isomerase/epimerase